MATYMHIDKTDITAKKETQVQFFRSNLEASEEVKDIEKKLRETPYDADLWMKKGLALAKQMLFREAIEAYSEGLLCNPFHSLLYRHRGHRYISIRRYQEAAADFEMCVRLDPQNWAAWYHLGLALYLLRRYSDAAKAYQRCLDLTKTEEDLVAVIDWYWMTMQRIGDRQKAQELLSFVTPDTDAGENISYKKRILLYKGLLTPEELMQFEGAEFPELEIATQGYGLSNYYYLKGDMEKSNAMLQQILSIKEFWSAFGYLAAQVDAEERGLVYENIDLAAFA